jgi:hypothetical protein
MEKGEPVLSDQNEKKPIRERYAEFVAVLLLSVVGMIGSFLVNRGFPVSDTLTLILFGTGILSAVILIR